MLQENTSTADRLRMDWGGLILGRKKTKKNLVRTKPAIFQPLWAESPERRRKKKKSSFSSAATTWLMCSLEVIMFGDVMASGFPGFPVNSILSSPCFYPSLELSCRLAQFRPTEKKGLSGCHPSCLERSFPEANTFSEIP